MTDVSSARLAFIRHSFDSLARSITDRPAVIVNIGLPASGKTTWTDQQIEADDTGRLTVVSRDHIRRMLRRPHRADENLVTGIQYAAIRCLLAAGKSVIVDDTNLSRVHLATLQATVLQAGANTVMINSQFLFTPVDVCVARDAARPEIDRVGEQVIRGLFERFRDVWPQMRESG